VTVETVPPPVLLATAIVPPAPAVSSAAVMMPVKVFFKVSPDLRLAACPGDVR